MSAGAVRPWVAIVGKREDGRDDVLLEVIAELRAAGLDVGGFVQHRLDDRGELAGVDAESLSRETRGKRIALARRSDTPDLCALAFSGPGLAEVASWMSSPCDVVVAEVGRLEASGRGHWPAVLNAIHGDAEHPRAVLLSVRPSALTTIALALPDPIASIELPSDSQAVLQLVQQIANPSAVSR